MSWLANWRLDRAARQYAQRLPTRLFEGWGGSKTYTRDQIDAAIRDTRLDPNFSYIAYAIFLPQEDQVALQALFERRSVAEVKAAFERWRRRTSGQGGHFYESGIG